MVSVLHSTHSVAVVVLAIAAALTQVEHSCAFVAIFSRYLSPSPPSSLQHTSTQRLAVSIEDIPDEAEWIPLVWADDDDEDDVEFPPVVKHTLQKGDDDTLPTKGSTVEIEYTGTLLSNEDWTTKDVIECWLSNLQGLDHLSSTFMEHEITGGHLHANKLTEEYCMNTLGISNKIQAKKLVMASKRLIKQKEEYPPGFEFDSSISRNKNYSFILGSGKAIKAIDLAVSSMKINEHAMIICRSDYGYRSEGLRSSKGEVLVPPFATLCFDLTLVSVTPP